MADNMSRSSPSPCLGLPALRLLVPPVRLIFGAIWQTVQQKIVADYGIVEEFVSMVTDMVPELLSRNQRAQLMLGLRARLILDLLEASPDSALLQLHLDRMQSLIQSWLLEAGGENTEVTHTHFMDLIQHLLKNPDEREHYFQTVFQEEFGSKYDQSIHALMWMFLTRLEEFLPVQPFSQVASMFRAGSCVLEECVQSVSQCEDFKSLLQFHKSLNQLTVSGLLPDGEYIVSALRLPSLCATETPEAQMKEAIADDAVPHGSPAERESLLTCAAEITSEAQPHSEDELREQSVAALHSPDRPSPRPVKECQVQVERLCKEAAMSSRPVRANRGRRMSKILQEERRELEAPPAKKPVLRKVKPSQSTAVPKKRGPGRPRQGSAPAPGSDEDSWSYYSDDSQASRCPSVAESWSYYSGQGSSFEDSLLENASSCSSSDSGSSFVRRGQSSKSQGRSGAKDCSEKRSRTYLCAICKEEVNINLRSHMKTHFPNKDYACPQCGARYKLLSSLLRHVKMTCFEYNQHKMDPDKLDESQNLSKCEQCGSVFRYKVSLKKHMATHHELYCSVCRRVLRDAQTLARHQTSHTPFQCTRCDESFTVFRHLIRHCENVHKISKPFKCEHCPKTSKKLRFLVRHEWQHLGRLPFQCALCNMKFKCDSDLVSHQKVHSGDKPYLCSDCGKTFSRRSNLYRHLRFLHSTSRNEKKHSCSQCEKSFKEKAALKKHQRSKHLNEVFRYPCPYCGKMVSSSTMARHKLIHTGQRPFKCTAPDCDKGFRSNTEVKRHVLLHHSTERPFSCDVCGKGFIRVSFLNEHAKIHSKEKPFACNICGKAFLKLYSMLRHKRLVHTASTE